jgi:hypothetical protein
VCPRNHRVVRHSDVCLSMGQAQPTKRRPRRAILHSASPAACQRNHRVFHRSHDCLAVGQAQPMRPPPPRQPP